MIRAYCWSVLTALFLLTTGRAADAEQPLAGTLRPVDPRPLGLGGVLLASPSGTSGVYLNPATIAMTPLYHMELMYQYTGQDAMHNGGVVVVDAITAVIAAGLAFNYSRIDRDSTDHTAYDGRLSLAGKIGELVFLGVTGRYLHVAQNTGQEGQGPGGVPALPASGSQQVDGFTFDAGAAFRLGEIVTAGITGYNLTNTGSVFAPLQLGGGISAVLAKMVRLELDVILDFTRYEKTNQELRGGVELFIAKLIAVRAGYAYDVHLDLHAISAGLGYIDSSFSLEAGFMREIADSGRMALGVGFKYFVN